MTETVPVSAIIPLFNGRRFIRQAVDSILGQELKPREIIVVDDGSTDGGHSLVSDCPEIRFVWQSNGGEAAARNRGVRQSTQPLIAFLDQDDLWLPQKLARQVERLEADPAVDLVYGQHRLFVDGEADWFRQDLLGHTLTAELPGSLVIRRTAFERVGPYREDIRLGSDIDWISRAKDAGIKMHLVEEVVLLRRVHQANASMDQALFTNGLLRLARASAQRKRGRLPD